MASTASLWICVLAGSTPLASRCTMDRGKLRSCDRVTMPSRVFCAKRRSYLDTKRLVYGLSGDGLGHGNLFFFFFLLLLLFLSCGGCGCASPCGHLGCTLDVGDGL
jgi:hypothetical protein